MPNRLVELPKSRVALRGGVCANCISCCRSARLFDKLNLLERLRLTGLQPKLQARRSEQFRNRFKPSRSSSSPRQVANYRLYYHQLYY
jgi:hypothetical protein